MRVVMPLAALLLTTGAASAQTVPIVPDSPPAMGRVIGQDDPRLVCRDRIHEVRRELGKPALEREAPATEPLLIAAVDKRIGPCSVMVMRNDTSDFRPLPAPAEHRLMPAR